MYSFVAAQILGFTLCITGVTATYSLTDSYDFTNWFSSFTFQDAPDPTNGFVKYVNLDIAKSSGLARIIGNQVYMGVDTVNQTTTGRNSVWIESNKSFLHGLLIGDFAHVPGGACGTWPSFWTIRNGPGNYGEIDIMEGFNDITQNYMTLHTGGACTFNPPANTQTGTSNNGNTDCSLNSAVGCSVQGPVDSYGVPLNANGGAVYAMEWTSEAIKIWSFPRNSVPSDINAGTPDPSTWGLPAGNFDSAYGNCNIDAQFPAQTIYFDTTFCGGNAGGLSWTTWTDCSTKTGFPTCEGFVGAHPEAFKDSYWLINSVKVYQSGGTPPSLTISTTGRCGTSAGTTCLGSTFGNCCSQHGWCGSTTSYCGTGCQGSFGSCS